MDERRGVTGLPPLAEGTAMFLLRAFAVWLVLMAAESVYGTLRTLLLAPRIGDFPARQASVITGSLLIVGIASLFIRWVQAGTLT